MIKKKGLLLVISGPSGAGKGTVCKELLERNPEFKLSVSATTRAPREGEVDGESYFFLTKEKFSEMIGQGGFLEYAQIYSNFYGTPKGPVMKYLEEGSDVILEIEMQGARQVKEMYPDVYPIVSHVGSMSLMANSDDLGGDIGSLESVSSDSTEVINYYATDKYMNEMKLRYDWAQKGLIMPDASTSTEMANSLIGSGKGFGRFTNTKPGIEQEIEKESGKEIVVLDLVEPYTTTTRVDIVWYVPHNSDKPERAVQI